MPSKEMCQHICRVIHVHTDTSAKALRVDASPRIGIHERMHEHNDIYVMLLI